METKENGGLSVDEIADKKSTRVLRVTKRKQISLTFNNFSTILKTSTSSTIGQITFEAWDETLFGEPFKWTFSLRKCERWSKETIFFGRMNPGFVPKTRGTQSLQAEFTMTFKDGEKHLRTKKSSLVSFFPQFITNKEEWQIYHSSLCIMEFFNFDHLVALNIDKLQIIVDLTIYIENSTGFIKELAEDFLKPLESGEDADAVIKVPNGFGGYYKKEVHKYILRVRSPVFKRMICSGESNKTNFKEGETGEIIIEDMTPAGLDAFLSFLYTGGVNFDNMWEVIEDLINASEKYDLPDLKTFCDENLVNSCDEENIRDLYKFAKTFGLKGAAMDIKSKMVEKLMLSKIASGIPPDT